MSATGTTTTTRRAGWIRRHRVGLLIGGAIVLATVFSIIAGNRAPYSEPLDPGNAAPDGARAVARVLGQEGVDVEVVRDSDAFDDALVDETTTVVVTSVGNLGPSTADRLLARARDAHLVLVDPPVGMLGLFGLDEGIRVSDPGQVTGGCDDPRFGELDVLVDRATAYPAGTGGCFATDDGALLVTDRERAITLLGAGELLTNGQVTRTDNAAVALRLFGEHERVVWYVPDIADLTGSDAVGLGTLLPDWLGPALWLVALAMIAVILWRGRRLGPLVTEPLPVSVTAIESTQSRGRLYRKVSDREHAAGTLRRAARSRIADHLHLPRSAAIDPEVLVRDIAALGGFDPERVRTLLSPGSAVPRTDKELTKLANDLAEFDREVRQA
jgi:hypothetical protein